MTTLSVVDGATHGESRTEAIARRLRSELAQINIKGTEAARICGVSQPWMSRRLNGTVPFGVDELDMVCTTLSIYFEYVAAGIWPQGPDGSLLPRLESNQQPFGCEPDGLRAAA